MGKRIHPDWDYANLLMNNSAEWYFTYAPEEWMENEVLVHKMGRHSTYLTLDIDLHWTLDVLRSNLSPADKEKALHLNFDTTVIGKKNDDS